MGKPGSPWLPPHLAAPAPPPHGVTLKCCPSALPRGASEQAGSPLPAPPPLLFSALLSPSVTLAAMCESNKSSDPKQPKAPRPSALCTSGVTQEAEQQGCHRASTAQPRATPMTLFLHLRCLSLGATCRHWAEVTPAGGQAEEWGWGTAGSLAAERHSPTRWERQGGPEPSLPTSPGQEPETQHRLTRRSLQRGEEGPAGHGEVTPRLSDATDTWPDWAAPPSPLR